MLAMVVESPRRAAVHEVPDPEPGAGEVLVRLQGAGVCASELPVWEGREWFVYPRAPGEPGHEGWGTVEAVGPGVEREPGTRVAFIGGAAHAEKALVADSEIVPIPQGIPPEVPFPGEPLACAVNAWRRAGIAGGERVAIVGGGFFALLLVQLCRGVAEHVEVVSRRGGALELARLGGATRTWQQPAQSPPEESYDVVFEVTGHQGPLDLAARLPRVRGRLVIAGYHQDGPRVVDMQMWNWRGLDVINAHERDPAVYARGLREAVAAVQEGRLNPTPLLTHTFALEEMNRAYATAEERPEGFVKAVWLAG